MEQQHQYHQQYQQEQQSDHHLVDIIPRDHYHDNDYEDDVCATASTSSGDGVLDATIVEGEIIDDKDEDAADDDDRCPWPSWPIECMAVVAVLTLGIVSITLLILNARTPQLTPVPSQSNPIANNISNSNTSLTATTSKSNSRPPPEFSRAKHRSQIQAILNISNQQLKNSHLALSRAFQWIVYQDSVLYNYSDFRLVQRFALVTLQYSTGSWSPYQGGWGTDSGTHVPECDWVGVDCDENYRVRALQLQNLAPTMLKGPIPHEIHWLQALRTLQLNDNELTGELPSGLYIMRNLEELDLSSNQLSSTLSPSIGNMTSLARLDLRNNSIVGALPSELGLARNLSQILLSQNEGIAGTVPTELGGLSYLVSFYVQQTGLIGSMPRQVCSLVAFGQLMDVRSDCSLNCTCCNHCNPV